MIVKELIEKLQEFPDTAQVEVWGPYGGYEPTRRVARF